jgi:hypothetical protein
MTHAAREIVGATSAGRSSEFNLAALQGTPVRPGAHASYFGSLSRAVTGVHVLSLSSLLSLVEPDAPAVTRHMSTPYHNLLVVRSTSDIGS